MDRPRKQAHPKPPIEPNQRSDTAVRQILVHLLGTLRANIEGVLEDLDPEPLHDLRVATRRTRIALSSIKGVLPDAAVDTFAPEFKWLGTVTGPCRDLDVQLIEMGAFQTRLKLADASLDPLHQLLTELRRDEHLRVSESLRSERFRLLIDGWDTFLNSDAADTTEPSNARRPVIDLAGERIFKAYRRVAKRGAKLTDDAPEEAFHRLRINAKKLRYLLEFFSSLYPEETVRPLVKELKRVQDHLGGFNDIVVQQERLVSAKEDLVSAGELPPETQLALTRLAGAMTERQEEHRRAFARTFASFTGAENQRLYRQTFG